MHRLRPVAAFVSIGSAVLGDVAGGLIPSVGRRACEGAFADQLDDDGWAFGSGDSRSDDCVGESSVHIGDMDDSLGGHPSSVVLHRDRLKARPIRPNHNPRGISVVGVGEELPDGRSWLPVDAIRNAGKDALIRSQLRLSGSIAGTPDDPLEQLRVAGVRRVRGRVQRSLRGFGLASTRCTDSEYCRISVTSALHSAGGRSIRVSDRRCGPRRHHDPGTC